MYKSQPFSIFLLSILLTYSLGAQELSSAVQRFVEIDTAAVAITNVTLIDGTGQSVKTNQTLIASEGKIVAVGDTGSVDIPATAMNIDGTGKTVIPGLIMLHEHLFYSKPFENFFSVGQMTFTFPRLYLAGGVTSIRTAGSIQPQTDLNVKQWIDEGKMTGPKMHVTGPFIERDGYQIPELNYIDGTSEIETLINYWADKGATSFKVYNHITKEDLEISVAAAHERGLKVTGHLCSLTYKEASDIGIDNLEHGFMVSSDFNSEKKENFCDPFNAQKSLRDLPENDPKIDTLIDHLIKTETAITTTPVVFEPYTNHEVVPGGGLDALVPQIRQRVQDTYDSAVTRGDAASQALFDKNLVWLKRFYDKGGQLVAGTDPTGAGRTVAGYANQRTVEILVEAGFSLVDAIKICTLDGARFLEVEDETGSVEVGKAADFLLINGNLEDDIKNIRNLELVFKDGKGFNSKKLFDSVEGQVGLN